MKRGLFLLLAAALAFGVASLPAPAPAQEASTGAFIERAAAAFALGALDEAERLLREALRIDPSNDRAIRLLAEVRIERERSLVGPRPSAVPDAAPQEEAGATAFSPPRLPLPSARPAARERRTWADPAARTGLRGVVVERYDDHVVLRLQVPPGALPGRTQAFARPPMFNLTLDGLADNLPRGPLEIGAAGLLRLRHSLQRREPPTTSLVLDLASADVPVDVTAGGGEIVVTVGALPAERLRIEGPEYRPPVQGTWRLAPAGGDGQAVSAGATLPEVLAVRVVDAVGRAVPGARVSFVSPDAAILFDAPGGRGGGVEVVTGAEGIASAGALSAGAAGAKAVRASVVAPDGSRSEVTLQVMIRTGPAASITAVAGTGQDVRVRTLIGVPLEVSVEDAYGNPVPGVEVRFDYVEGGGWLRPSFDTPVEPVTVTDARGKAAWSAVRAGPYPGRHRVAASCEVGGRTRTTAFDLRAVPVLVSFDWKDVDLVEAIRAIAAAAGWNIIITDAFVNEYERTTGMVQLGGTEQPHEGRADQSGFYRGRITARFESVSAEQVLDRILEGKEFARIERDDGTIVIGTLLEALRQGGGLIDGDAIPENLPDNQVRTAAFVMPRTFTNADQANLITFLGAGAQQQTLFDYYTRQIRMTAQVGLLRRVGALLGSLREGQEVRAFSLRGMTPSGAMGLIQGAFGQIAGAANDEGQVLMVTADRATLDRIEALLAQVDRPRVRIYHLRYFPPSRFVRDILPQAVFGATVQNVATTTAQTSGAFGQNFAVTTGVQQVSTPRFTAYPMDVTGDLIVEAAAGDEKVHDEITSVIAAFDTAAAQSLLHGGLEPRLYTLRHGTGASILNWIRTNRVLGAAEWVHLRGDGALALWAAPGTHQVVADIIGAFDRPDFSYEAALVYHVRAGDPAMIAQAVQSLFSGVGVIQMTTARRLVVIGGGPEVMRTIESLDVPTEGGTFIRVYELQHVKPSDIDRLIGQTIADDREEQVTTFDWSTFTWRSTTRPASNIRRVPYDSLKKILVQATQELHGQVIAIINAFDTPGSGNLSRLEFHAFNVHEADLTSLAQYARQTALNPDDLLLIDTGAKRLLVWAAPTSLAKLDSTFWATFDNEFFRFGKVRLVQIRYGTIFLSGEFDVSGLIVGMFPEITARPVNIAGTAYIAMRGPDDVLDEAEKLLDKIDQPAVRDYRMKHIPPSAFLKVINRVIFTEGMSADAWWWYWFSGTARDQERFRAMPIDADSMLIIVARPGEYEVLAEIDAAYNLFDTTSALSILTGEMTAKWYTLRHAHTTVFGEWLRAQSVLGTADYTRIISDSQFVVFAPPGVQALVSEAIQRMDFDGFDFQRYRLIRPRVARPADVQAAITAAFPNDVQVAPSGAGSTLFIIGSADRLDEVERLVRVFDQDLEGLQVIRFRYIPPSFFAQELLPQVLAGDQPVFTPIVQQGEATPRLTVFRFSRFTAFSFDGAGLLYVTANEGQDRAYNEIRAAALQFDTAASLPLLRREIGSFRVSLRHAKANEVVQFLRDNGMIDATNLAIYTDDASVVFLAPPGRRAQIEATVEAIDQPEFRFFGNNQRAAGEFVRIYNLRNMKPTDLGRLIDQTIAQVTTLRTRVRDPITDMEQINVQTTTNIRYYPVDATMKIVVQTTGDLHDRVRLMIESFDLAGQNTNLTGIVYRPYTVLRASPLAAMEFIRGNYLTVAPGEPQPRILLFPGDTVIHLWANQQTHDRLDQRFWASIDRPEFLRETSRLVRLREIDAAVAYGVLNSIYPDRVQQVDGVNGIMIQAEGTLFDEIRGMTESLDKSSHTAIRPLFAASADDLTTIISGFSSPAGDVAADAVTNSLIITDSLERLDKILQVIEELDVAPTQILIEAAFVEVSLSDNAALGVAWNWNPDLTALNIPFRQANVQAVGGAPGLPAPSTLNPNINLPTGYYSNPAGDAIAPLDVPHFGSSGMGSNTFQLGVAKDDLSLLVQALKATNEVRIVSTPKVLTINNQQANFDVSDEINIPVTNFDDQGNPISSTFDQRPFSISLTVTPRVSVGGNVIRMEVNPTVEEPVAQTVGPATVSRREARTTVMIQDGHTLIIGGLIRKKETERIRKVPLLGDIPGIGHLFRNTTKDEENRELLVFLTPRIISADYASMQMEEELSRYRYLVNYPVDWTGAARRIRPTSTQVRVGLGGAGGTAAAPARPRLDVNRATVEEFAALPGMPDHVARLVVLDRQTRGAFGAVADLRRVPGMTDELLRSIEPRLEAAPAPAPAFAPAPAYVPPAASYAPPAPAPRPAYVPPAPAPQPAYVPPAPASAAATAVDLNAAPAEALAALPGFDEFQARMIVAYRASNGPFASADALLAVPGVTAEAVAAARPYLTLGASSAAAVPPPPAAPSAAAPAGLVDLNAAPAEVLATVPGLEDFHARMIVAYRTTYGPFAGVEGLRNVPGITPEVYEKIRDRLYVPSAAVRSGKTNLNTASEADIAGLPGLDSYYAKLIVAYRSYYGPFATVEDVLKVPGVTREMLAQFQALVTVDGQG